MRKLAKLAGLIICAATLAISALAFTACGGGNAEVESITLSDPSATLEVGQTKQLTATVNPENAKDKTYYWESNDESIATVNESGLVTAVAAGSCSIFATSKSNEDIYGECQVTVTIHREELFDKITQNDSTALGTAVTTTLTFYSDNTFEYTSSFMGAVPVSYSSTWSVEGTTLTMANGETASDYGNFPMRAIASVSKSGIVIAFQVNNGAWNEVFPVTLTTAQATTLGIDCSQAKAAPVATATNASGASVILRSDNTCDVDAVFGKGTPLELPIVGTTTWAVTENALTFGTFKTSDSTDAHTISITANGLDLAIVANTLLPVDTVSLTVDGYKALGLTVVDVTGITANNANVTVASGSVTAIDGLVAFTPANATIKGLTVEYKNADDANKNIVVIDGTNLKAIKAGSVTVVLKSVADSTKTCEVTVTVTVPSAADRGITDTTYYETETSFTYLFDLGFMKVYNRMTFKTDGTVEYSQSTDGETYKLTALGHYSKGGDTLKVSVLGMDNTPQELTIENNKFSYTVDGNPCEFTKD